MELFCQRTHQTRRAKVPEAEVQPDTHGVKDPALMNIPFFIIFTLVPDQGSAYRPNAPAGTLERVRDHAMPDLVV